MFSKLHAHDGPVPADLPMIEPPFGTPRILEPILNGTLGICYLVTVGGARRFLKTHGSTPDARANLAKEIGLIRYLHGESLHVECLKSHDNRLWLAMDELDHPAVAPSPEDIRELTTANCRKLETYPHRDDVPAKLDFYYLLSEGEDAFGNLVEAGKLRGMLVEAIPFYLDLLRRLKHQAHVCISHGDLGPRNLLAKDGRLIAVDWEDAFWGIEGYDYLYWLTFFENRRHLGSHVFGFTPWGKDAEIGILLLILLLKCELSMRKGTYHKDTLTFDERLMEVLLLA